MLSNQTRALVLLGLSALASCKSSSDHVIEDSDPAKSMNNVRITGTNAPAYDDDLALQSLCPKERSYKLYHRDQEQMAEAIAGGELPDNPILAAQVRALRQMQAAPEDLRPPAEVRSDTAKGLRSMLDALYFEGAAMPAWKERGYKIAIAESLALIDPAQFSRAKLELYDLSLDDVFVIALPYSQPTETRTPQQAAASIRNMTDFILRIGYEDVSIDERLRFKLRFADAIEAIDPYLRESRSSTLGMDLRGIVQFSNELADHLSATAK